MYTTIKTNSQTMIEIKKSKFIAYSYYVESAEEVGNLIAKLKTQYPEANHYCYGYIIDSVNKHFSDDGEPSNTAGKPIMNVIEKQGLIKTLVVVVRIFGGIKLGAGGLVRAYTQACSEVLAVSEKTVMVASAKGNITCSYTLYEKLKYFLKDMPVRIEETLYEENIKLTIVTKGDWKNFEKIIKNFSNGKIETEYIDSIYSSWS